MKNTRSTHTQSTHTQSTNISVAQGIALIFGTNIGAGILSFPYAARNGGFLALVIALLIAGTLTTFSMMYVAEVSLRTKEPLQLAGLAEKYLGAWGRWVIFASIIVNSIGALVAYASGSGSILSSLLGIPPLGGTLIFFFLGSFIMWKGLHAAGLVEGLITCGMATIILILSGWTIFGPGIDINNLLVLHPFFIIQILNLAVFTFMAQYIVPELVRGLSEHNPKQIPHVIVGGMVATGFTLSLVPFVALGLLGTEVTEVITIAWGESLGRGAYYLANIFGLFAMFTSLIAIGYTTMRNVLDTFHWQQHSKHRIVAVLITVAPPLVIAILGLGGFVKALSYAGGFAGVAMSIVPVLLLHLSRKRGDRAPAWRVTWQGHPLIQAALIIAYFIAFLYTLATIFNILPPAWT